MHVVEFNALGQPRDGSVRTGDVCILVQAEAVAVMRVEILAPEAFGPALEPAKNQGELETRARRALAEAFPSGLPKDRDWVVSCPEHIAAAALF